jgi:2-deoxy-D-gluconate 3-dehydrogenase
LDGKKALITGSRRGIGAGIAAAFAEQGADVGINDIERDSEAEKTIAGIEKLGRKASWHLADISSAADRERMFDEFVAEHGRIDVLVNNAGVNIPRDALDVDEADWDTVMDVNLKGLFFMSQRVGRRMVNAGGGKIVNIASQNGVIGYYRRAAYCSSKAGVVNLTRVLALEWAPHGITVNAVGPTFILTPLTQSTFDDPALREDLLKRIPLGRVGKPEDVVGAVVFLASPAADLITGHTLLVDGGWTAV